MLGRQNHLPSQCLVLLCGKEPLHVAVAHFFKAEFRVLQSPWKPNPGTVHVICAPNLYFIPNSVHTLSRAGFILLW